MLAQPAQLEAVSYGDIEGWREDGLAPAFEAFCQSARRMLDGPYSTKALGADSSRLKRLGELALSCSGGDASQAREFFEQNFQPHRVTASQPGFLTGYFEPEVVASRSPNSINRYPLFRRPDDLIDLRDNNRPADMDPGYRFGRATSNGVQPYHDRAAIDGGVLEGRGLEIAWLADRVDQFFIHVQGAARLRFSDELTTRVTFAGKSGHPYTSLGKVLCERLNVSPPEMTADRVATWMRRNPDQLDGLLAQNRSYIFFREIEDQPADEGPIAAAGCPLTPGCSLAVDRTLHTFGTPIWIATREAFVDSTEPLRRLMIAQDTGSAITGPCRGDIFLGSGQAAGFLAGQVRHEMDMITLLPRENS